MYTEVVLHDVRRTVDLPGTVEARVEGAVATEVAGLVDEILAREGAQVTKGTALVRLNDANLALTLRAKQAELKEAEARLSAARRALERAKGLAEESLLSAGEYDDTEADFLAYQGRVEKLGVDIERIRLDLDRCTIRSRIAGVVTEEHVEVGTWIQVGDPVVDVLSTEELLVRVDVPERYFGDMRVGEPATIKVAASRGAVLQGTVGAVIPKADRRSRVFPVKVRIEDPAAAGVAAGMLVQVSIPVGEAMTSLIVPKDAVVPQGPTTIVYVLGDDGSAVATPITVGQGAGLWVAVTGEIEAGMKVIVRGNERVFPGQTFRGEAMEYPLP